MISRRDVTSSLAGRPRPLLVALAALVPLALLALLPAFGQAPPDDSALAERQLEAARELEESEQLERAREIYARLAESAPPEVAAASLSALARLDWPVTSLSQLGDPEMPATRVDEARAHLEALVDRFPSSTRAPAAQWRIALARLEPRAGGYSPSDALAALLVLPTLYPDAPEAAGALALSAELELGADRHERARQAAFRVLSEYPDAPSAGRAWLVLGEVAALAGRDDEALFALGRAQASTPEGSSASLRAMDLASLVDRFARVERGAALPIAPDEVVPFDLRVEDLAATDAGTLLAVSEREDALYVLEPGGASQRRVVSDARAVAADPLGRAWVGGRALLAPPGMGVYPLPEDFEVVALAVASGRDVWIVGDRQQRALRIGPKGFIEASASLPDRAEIIAAARTREGGLALLDERSRELLFFGPEGAIMRRMSLGGVAPDAIDFALDPLGHVYVLDERANALFVLSSEGALLARVGLPDEGPVALSRPELVAVDGRGHVAVYDERARRILWLR